MHWGFYNQETSWILQQMISQDQEMYVPQWVMWDLYLVWVSIHPPKNKTNHMFQKDHQLGWSLVDPQRSVSSWCYLSQIQDVSSKADLEVPCGWKMDGMDHRGLQPHYGTFFYLGLLSTTWYGSEKTHQYISQLVWGRTTNIKLFECLFQCIWHMNFIFAPHTQVFCVIQPMSSCGGKKPTTMQCRPNFLPKFSSIYEGN